MCARELRRGRFGALFAVQPAADGGVRGEGAAAWRGEAPTSRLSAQPTDRPAQPINNIRSPAPLPCPLCDPLPAALPLPVPPDPHHSQQLAFDSGHPPPRPAERGFNFLAQQHRLAQPVSLSQLGAAPSLPPSPSRAVRGRTRSSRLLSGWTLPARARTSPRRRRRPRAATTTTTTTAGTDRRRRSSRRVDPTRSVSLVAPPLLVVGRPGTACVVGRGCLARPAG